MVVATTHTTACTTPCTTRVAAVQADMVDVAVATLAATVLMEGTLAAAGAELAAVTSDMAALTSVCLLAIARLLVVDFVFRFEF